MDDNSDRSYESAYTHEEGWTVRGDAKAINRVMEFAGFARNMGRGTLVKPGYCYTCHNHIAYCRPDDVIIRFRDADRNVGATNVSSVLGEAGRMRALVQEAVFLEGTSVELMAHAASVCAGPPCPIHHRSDHAMRKFPQHWRQDRLIMERICEHGVGHPDPDDPNTAIDNVHGCDGCCRERGV